MREGWFWGGVELPDTHYVSIIDSCMAQVLSARSDKQELTVFFKEPYSEEAFRSIARIPWVRRINVLRPLEPPLPVIDLRQLAAATELRELVVNGSLVREVEDAWSFEQLRKLMVREAGDIQLSGIERLKHLEKLSLDGKSVDLGPLASTRSLQSLHVVPAVSSLQALGSLAGIRSLTVKVSPRVSLSPLAKVTALHELVIQGANLKELIQAVKDLPAFTRLFIDSDKRLRDVRPLKQLERLELISVAETSVEDISPLADLPRLKHLNFWATPVKSILPLTTGFKSLQSVTFDYSDEDAAILSKLRPDLRFK